MLCETTLVGAAHAISFAMTALCSVVAGAALAFTLPTSLMAPPVARAPAAQMMFGGGGGDKEGGGFMCASAPPFFLRAVIESVLCARPAWQGQDQAGAGDVQPRNDEEV